MTTFEILDKKVSLQKRVQSLFATAEQEERFLTADEQAEYEQIKRDISELDTKRAEIEAKLEQGDVNAIEAEERSINNEINQENHNIMYQNFSLVRAINDVINHREMSETESNYIALGAEQMKRSGQSYSGHIQLPLNVRDLDGVLTAQNFNSSVNQGGKEAVPTDTYDILGALRNRMVLADAGATYLDNLAGNVVIPSYTGSTANWAGENTSAGNGVGTMSQIELTPKRLTTYVDISKQLLIQTSGAVERMLKEDIVNAIAEKLESTILSATDGSTNYPAGLLANTSVDTSTSQLTYKSMVDLEAALENANIPGSYTYIVNPVAKASLKTKAVDAGSGRFIMQDNEIDGYPVLTSKGVVNKGILFGNFRELVIGQWGSLDVIVDDLTLARDAKVRLVINAYFDAKLRRSGAVVGKILV